MKNKKQPKVAPKKVVATKSDNSFTTKIQRVANHLITHGSITSWEAIKLFKATRLSAIIFTLKERGYCFTTTRETSKNANFARYTYIGMQSEQPTKK